ncbi:hypothetical protein [Streptomyces sp. SID13726]|uniref:hypothetical protein n=1 Tax=Streptomyces sp. SID13726 TaxID=2706058 RepID=UPI0013B7AEE8|nr:hypothetical protein [Streptomyces sp. SID13726]NEB02234.1 hypothetical protein [Streptomyces sp. SID13726]
MAPPSWLRPGPHSPNLEQSPDPEQVYDDLGEKPRKCTSTLAVIEAQPDEPRWQVLRGLAEACRALQGQGGDWDAAARYFTATEGRLDTCKGRAARTVLGDVLRFHREHPSAEVTLRGSGDGSGADVCDFRITEVTAGGAGEPITITVSGAYFSADDLISTTVLVDGLPSTGEFEIVSRSGDGFSFTAEVPPLDAYPKTVDVSIDYGIRTTKRNAVTVQDPNPTTAASASP